MKTITLKAGKERSALRFHPWVFDSAIAKGGGDPGETVRVESQTGQFLGWASFSPTSKIRARIWSFQSDERIDSAFFERQVAAAVAMRARLQVPSNGVRLIHGEADGLPGLIVDRYDDTLVAQFLSAGTERFKADIVKALVLHTDAKRVFERSDSGVRGLEGLPAVTGWLHRAEGANDDTAIVIQEHDWSLQLDIAEGHKTGFYLDQRDSRLKFAEYARRLNLRQVLNCYGYTGGFSVAALSGMRQSGALGAGAEVITVDSSGPAIAKAQANVQRNGFTTDNASFMDADVNATLRSLHKEGRQFDGIVLDPPKFAPSAAHADRAARAYKDINRWAFKLLAPGGVLFTYSCSGGIPPELFHKIVASAGTDSGVDAYILERVQAAPDHP
ncbi:MAG: class I SAM-dependent methyltransferase, partial [Limnohabitans sp.]|nr:class I SAM-dependent methyltransferase [Limnohabitans sp.]